MNAAKLSTLSLEGIGQLGARMAFYLEGREVPLEEIFKTGFTVSPNDAPAVLTLIENFIRAREERSC